MVAPEASRSRSLIYPAAMVLVVLTTVIVAGTTFLIVRFWQFPPSVTPVVLNSQDRAELDKFDEELRHYADQRISIDLDDGVKHNYGKFGNLLAR